MSGECWHAYGARRQRHSRRYSNVVKASRRERGIKGFSGVVMFVPVMVRSVEQKAQREGEERKGR